MYWTKYALLSARFALREFGLIPCPSAPERNLVQLMGDEGFANLTPMQQWASSVPLIKRPTLYVIEDSTGAGKTEAALILAHRLMVAERASGIYFALPTMATANALYGRLAKAYLNLFTKGSRPSLVLAHAARDLDRRFTESLFYESDAPNGADSASWSWTKLTLTTLTWGWRSSICCVHTRSSEVQLSCCQPPFHRKRESFS